MVDGAFHFNGAFPLTAARGGGPINPHNFLAIASKPYLFWYCHSLLFLNYYLLGLGLLFNFLGKKIEAKMEELTANIIFLIITIKPYLKQNLHSLE